MTLRPLLARLPGPLLVALVVTLSAPAAAAAAFDLEGHRGARGLRPENTLAAFGHPCSSA